MNYDKAVSAYIQNMKNNELSVNTIEGYARTFRLFRESMVRNGYEEAVPAAVMSFRTDISDNSITTVNLYMGHLRQLSEFAERYSYLPRFVFDDAMPPKGKVTKAKNKAYDHVLSLDQIHALLTAERPVYGRKPRTWLREQAEMTLMLMSGARNSELRALCFEDLDFENKCMYLRVTKGNKPRIVPFPESAQKAVLSYVNSDLYVTGSKPLFGCFDPKTGVWHGLERQQLSALTYNYTKSVIGEENACRTHAQRHGFASAALEIGVTVDEISSVLGHADTAVTARYAQRLNPHKLVSSIGGILDGALT